MDELFEEAMAVTSKHGFFSPAAIDIKASVVRKILWMLSFNAPRKLCRELGYKMGKAMLELEALGIDVTVEEPPDAPPLSKRPSKRHCLHSQYFGSSWHSSAPTSPTRFPGSSSVSAIVI